MTEVEIAEVVATLVHFGQTTKSDEMPYIWHPASVVATLPHELKPAGWLHDVLEDTFVTEHHLKQVGITPATIAIVKIVSRVSPETYHEFIRRVGESGNRGAIEVKIADLRHNLRSGCPASLEKRYRPALAYLEGLLRG